MKTDRYIVESFPNLSSTLGCERTPLLCGYLRPFIVFILDSSFGRASRPTEAYRTSSALWELRATVHDRRNGSRIILSKV